MAGFPIEVATRIKTLPPYLFAAIDKMKQAAIARGVDIIKLGIGHIHLAFVDPGDIVLVPSPGYPVYPVGTAFSGGLSHIMPLTRTNGFLPDLHAIPKDVANKAKLMWLNSPNNPTSVVMTKEY